MNWEEGQQEVQERLETYPERLTAVLEQGFQEYKACHKHYSTR